MTIIAFPAAAGWNLGTGLEATSVGIRLVIGTITDTFDSAENLLTGGDGAKTNWSVLNTASASIWDIQTTNAGKCTCALGASTDQYMSQFNAPFMYRNITYDFEFEFYATDNGDAQWEQFRVTVEDTAASAGLDHLGLGSGYAVGGLAIGLVRENTVNSSTSYTTIPNNGVAPGYMKVTRVGNVFTLYSKVNSGDAWTSRYVYTRDDFSATVRVGISFVTANTQNNYVAQIHSATFGSFYYSPSPEAESPWIALPFTTLSRLDIVENGLSGASGAIKYQYATNNGAYNGAWVTFAAMNTSLSNTTITNTTNSLRLKIQFESTGTVRPDVILGSYVTVSGSVGGSGGCPIIGGSIIRSA